MIIAYGFRVGFQSFLSGFSKYPCWGYAGAVAYDELGFGSVHGIADGYFFQIREYFFQVLIRESGIRNY